MAPLKRPLPMAGARRQAGDVLLYVLFALLVLLLGALLTMRGEVTASVMTGHMMQRQKNVQAGDAALALVKQMIVDTVQAAGNVPLEIAATGKPWFVLPTSAGVWPAPGAPGANQGYWSSCGANNAAQPCAPVSGMPAGASALVVVAPTNRPTDPYICGTTGYTAVYYDIFLHVSEAAGATAADTETVFKLCTP